MNGIVDVLVSIFNFLTNTEIFGVGLIWWILAPALIGLAIDLIAKRGDNYKNNDG